MLLTFQPIEEQYTILLIVSLFTPDMGMMVKLSQAATGRHIYGLRSVGLVVRQRISLGIYQMGN